MIVDNVHSRIVRIFGTELGAKLSFELGKEDGNKHWLILGKYLNKEISIKLALKQATIGSGL